MSDAFLPGVVGGLIGGALGVLGTLISSYYGPRKIEEWREKRLAERYDGPRKRLLIKMLDDVRFPEGRKLETLTCVTGTESIECRRLLIEVGARGVILAGSVEGWALISRKPLDSE